jgi:predicted ester cyclase
VRRRSGWTQAEAARRGQVSDRLIRTAERGGPIDRHSAEVLSGLFQIPLDALLADGNPPAATAGQMAARACEFLDQIWNHRNLAVIETHLAAEFRYHHDAGIALGRDGMRARVEGFQRSFTVNRVIVEDSVEYGDFVVCRWIFEMTHSGPWLDLAPTGKQVAVPGSSWVQVVDGKFGDAWDYWDSSALYESLRKGD